MLDDIVMRLCFCDFVMANASGLFNTPSVCSLRVKMQPSIGIFESGFCSSEEISNLFTIQLISAQVFFCH